MPPETTLILVVTLVAISAVLVVWIYTLDRRIKKLVAGKDAKSLEGAIVALGEDLRDLEKWRDGTTSYLTDADKRIKRSIQGVETIRFNAFKGNGEGGNQSFAIALISENGDGTVISSIYARDRVSVFAKPVKNFVSEFEMTEEEKEAVRRTTQTK